MRTELLRFNGAVERDPAIDAWMKSTQVNWEASRIRSDFLVTPDRSFLVQIAG